MTDDVRNNTDKSRFELDVDGHIAVAYYTIAGDVMTFTHTVVPKELEGRGIGSKLIKSALEQVRAQGLKVIPQCSFVKSYIDRHSEFADLLK